MAFFIERGVNGQPLKAKSDKQMILSGFGLVKQAAPERKESEAAYKIAKKAAQNRNSANQNILASYSNNPEEFLQRANRRRERQ